MQLTYTCRYFNKNFYKDIGLSPHFTFKGLFKRIKRRHPLKYRFTVAFINVALTTSLGLILIPGSVFPFQRMLKIYAFQKLDNFSQFWNLNSFNTNTLQYVADLGKIMKYGLENRVFQKQQILLNLKKQIDVLTSEELIISTRIRIEVLNNFSELLLMLLEDRFKMHVLKENQIKEIFLKVIEEGALKVKQGNQIPYEMRPSYLFSLKIYEYLLKFTVQPSEKAVILKKLSQNTRISGCKNKSDWIFYGRQLAKEQGLKNELKKLLVFPKQSQVHKQIMKILKQTDSAINFKTE